MTRHLPFLLLALLLCGSEFSVQSSALGQTLPAFQFPSNATNYLWTLETAVDTNVICVELTGGNANAQINYAMVPSNLTWTAVMDNMKFVTGSNVVCTIPMTNNLQWWRMRGDLK